MRRLDGIHLSALFVSHLVKQKDAAIINGFFRDLRERIRHQ